MEVIKIVAKLTIKHLKIILITIKKLLFKIINM